LSRLPQTSNSREVLGIGESDEHRSTPFHQHLASGTAVRAYARVRRNLNAVCFADVLVREPRHGGHDMLHYDLFQTFDGRHATTPRHGGASVVGETLEFQDPFRGVRFAHTKIKPYVNRPCQVLFKGMDMLAVNDEQRRSQAEPNGQPTALIKQASYEEELQKAAAEQIKRMEEMLKSLPTFF